MQRAAQDASGTVTTEYDEAGRLKRTVDSFGAEAIFSYDTEGNLLNRTTAAGALTSSPNYTTTAGPGRQVVGVAGEATSP